MGEKIFKKGVKKITKKAYFYEINPIFVRIFGISYKQFYNTQIFNYLH